MNKKILIGSIIAVAILLLMPSVSAIQQKIVKDEIRDKIVSELSNDLDFKDIRELLENGFLAQLIIYILGIVAGYRVARGILLLIITSNYLDGYEEFKINYPIMFIRSIWLIGTGTGFFLLLEAFVKVMGWGW